MKLISVAVLFSLILGACTNYELSRRYSKIVTVEQSAVADVDVAAFPIASSPPTSVTSLSDRGQAAFIEALATKTSSASAFRSELAEAIRGAPKPDLALERERRRLVLSVFPRDGFEPGDRISEVVVNLKLKREEQKFLSWDRFEAQDELVELGKITRADTTTRSLSSGATTSLPSFPIGAEIAGSLQNVEGITEEQVLRQRRIVLGGSLKPNQISLLMEGIAGIDLVGNATIQVDLRTGEKDNQAVFVFSNINKKPTLARRTLTYPTSACDVVAEMRGHYVVRKIALTGWPFGGEARTNQEGDDTVDFQKYLIGIKNPESGEIDPIDVIIFTPKEPSVLKIGDVRNKDQVQYMIEAVAGADLRPIYFTTRENAELFKGWMISELNAGRQVRLDGGRKVFRKEFKQQARLVTKSDVPYIEVLDQRLGKGKTDCD